MGYIVTYLLTVLKYTSKFKARISKLNVDPLCLDNLLKDFSSNNIKKTGL